MDVDEARRLVLDDDFQEDMDESDYGNESDFEDEIDENTSQVSEASDLDIQCVTHVSDGPNTLDNNVTTAEHD